MEINFFHYEDPLSDVTRKVLRNLLASASISYLIVCMGLVPTKMDTLGIEFSKQNQTSFLAITLLVVFYFELTFFVYAIEDFIKWKTNIKKEDSIKRIAQSKALIKDAIFRKFRSINEFDKDEMDRQLENDIEKEVKLLLDQSLQKYHFLGYVRILLDIIIPVLFGLVAILLLTGKLLMGKYELFL